MKRLATILLLISFATNAQDGQMTEEERNNFINKGIEQETRKEACDDMGKHCNQGANPSTGGVEDATEIAYKLAFTYLISGTAMKVIMGGGLSEVKKLWDFSADADKVGSAGKEVGAAAGAEAGVEAGGETAAEGSESSSSDNSGVSIKKVCNLLAIASVGGVWVLQKSKQNKVSEKVKATNQESIQAEGLYQIANLHKSKRNDAITLASVFGGLTACYTIAGFQYAPYSYDIEAFIRAGLSALLTTGYSIAADKHKKVADKAAAYAKAMPNKGECAPGSACFCHQKSELSQQFHDNEFRLNCGELANNDALCLDKYGRIDKECLCKKNNTCISKSISSFLSRGNTGQNLKNKVNKLAKSFETGDFKPDLDKNLKFADSYVNRGLKKSKNAKGLNSKQKKLAAAFIKNGMNSKLASHAAKIKVSNKDKLKDIENSPYSLASFKKPKKKSRSKSGLATSTSDDLSDIFGDTDEIQQLSKVSVYSESDRVLAAQQIAMDRASVHPSDSKPIFNIISTSYLRSDIWHDVANND